MIPLAYITQWRQISPWPDDTQVEQDLILSRIIVEIFSDLFLRKELAFRGGTALNKLFFKPAARYSEDIDLVRTGSGSIKPIIDRLHDCLNAWLGEPRTERTKNNFKLKYSFSPENSSKLKQNIKIEINTREIFSVYDRTIEKFSIKSSWFTGEAEVNTYQFEELIATKLRALYQRRKGRDLFDLWLALQVQGINLQKVIQAFQGYMKKERNVISRTMFEKNIDLKLKDSKFTNDIEALLSPKFKQRQSKILTTQNRFQLAAENGVILMTQGWSLEYAAEELKVKLLRYLV